MTPRRLLPALFLAAALPALAQPAPAPRPEREQRETPSLERQCRRAVENAYGDRTLSRRNNDRQRLIQACISNGGKLPDNV